MDAEEAEFWRRWTERRDTNARNALIQIHAPWARLLARDIYLRLRLRWVEWSDYVQSATVGLIEAANRFDPSRGVEFHTYARHRIRGAVFDNLRQLSESAEVAAQGVHVERSRSLEDAEQGDSLQSFVSWTVGLGIGYMLDMASLPEPDESPEGPYAAAEWSQRAELLRAAVARLPERERIVLTMHYFQQMPFVEVARFMDLSKGRISQLHRQGVEHLRMLL